jgi:putative methyltransferase (TIGR04325 family)
MPISLKRLYRSLMISSLIQVIRGGVVYRGNYQNWQEAVAASEGYDSDQILKKVCDALLKVKNGEAAYERDSVLFEEIQYSWPLLAALLWIASRQDNCLNLMDFGGSLGSSYFQNREFLGHLSQWHWNVVEQEKFVRCGKTHFEDQVLKFYYTVDECFAKRHPNTFLFSGVLPYLEKPYELLQDCLSHQPEYVIIDRTPFIEGNKDRLTVQKVPREIYGGSYPAWMLSKRAFLEVMQEKYELMAAFEALSGAIDLGDDVAQDSGFIFKRRD